MSLHEHYEQLFIDGIQNLKAERYSLDHALRSGKDNRFGITLLARPDAHCIDAMESFMTKIRALEPEQYYYPPEDVHVTALTIISAKEGFNLADIHLPDYIQTVQHALTDQYSFTIAFKGLALSPGAILVRGMTSDETLNDCRNKLRSAFKASDLYNSIDCRYIIVTAHATVVRYQQPLQRTQELIDLLTEHEYHYFGTTSVEQLELVYNDWYQRKDKVELLATIPLKHRN